MRRQKGGRDREVRRMRSRCMCGLGGLGGRCRVWETTVVKAISRDQKKVTGGRAYNFDSAVPGTRAKCVLRYQIPMYCKDFSIMLFPASNWEFVKPDVEELNGAIAGRYHALVPMQFGPGKIVERVLGVEP